MVLLIQKSDVEKSFQIAIGRSETEFNNFIRECQMFDLKPLLPERFFFDILENISNGDYALLLNGGKYTYDGSKYQLEGLKAVLCHFTYGSYLLKGNITDTSHGHVIKKNNYSDPVEYKERKDWYTKHRQHANILFEEVKSYLDRVTDEDSTKFPLWTEDKCKENKIQRRTFRTKIIR